jgi:hypothetical protein
MNTPDVKWDGHTLQVGLSRYLDNDRIAIVLFRGHEHYTTATANVPDAVDLAANEVLVKDYMSHHGLLAALVAAGIVRDTGRRVSTGFVTIPVATLLIDPPPFR